MRLAAAVVAVACLAARAHAQPLPFVRHDGDSFLDVRAADATSFEDGGAVTKVVDLTAQYLLSRDAGVYGEFGGAPRSITRARAAASPRATGAA